MSTPNFLLFENILYRYILNRYISQCEQHWNYTKNDPDGCNTVLINLLRITFTSYREICKYLNAYGWGWQFFFSMLISHLLFNYDFIYKYVLD